MTTELFNLVESRWIPVLWRSGRFERVGIRRALAESGRIRQIAASNPMDNVALLRFLLAVLLWCKPALSDEDRKRLDGADGVPEDWLARLDEHQAAFNLLGDGERFYQDQAVNNNARPIGDLLVEFPTETKIAHFRHVRDKEYGLCPACCALGIIRFCAFANAYGGGRYTSAINGPTPAYSVQQDGTLLETLRLNLPAEAGLKRDPPWLTNNAPERDELEFSHRIRVAFSASLARQPRRGGRVRILRESNKPVPADCLHRQLEASVRNQGHAEKVLGCRSAPDSCRQDRGRRERRRVGVY